MEMSRLRFATLDMTTYCLVVDVDAHEPIGDAPINVFEMTRYKASGRERHAIMVLSPRPFARNTFSFNPFLFLRYYRVEAPYEVHPFVGSRYHQLEGDCL